MQSIIDIIMKKGGLKNEVIFVFDDILDKDTHKCPSICKIFTQGRHYNISCIVIAQDAMMLMNQWRRNMTMIILLRVNGRARETVLETWLCNFINPADGSWKKKGRAILQGVFNKPYHAVIGDFETNELTEYKVAN